MDRLVGMVLGILMTGMYSPALAQSFTRAPGWHLSPQAGTYSEAGVGSPTVVFRKKHGDFVMFFESMVARPDADCTVGYWGISYATSADGLNWTQAPSQMLPNIDGSYFECVAAHPYAVIDDNGDDIHVWFKGEQGTQACDGGNQPWGCGQYTGVGYAKFDENLEMVSSSAAPVVDEAAKFGYPAVVRVDDTWYMMLARYPSFFLATSSTPDSGWSMANGGAAVMLPGVTTWSQDELFNPALVCDNNSNFPFQVYFGGRNYGEGWPLIDQGGWGDAISAIGIDWFVNAAPHFNWSGNDAWRHWDALKIGEERLVWFSEKEGGVNNIGFAYTAASWDEHDIESRLCPEPSSSGLVPGDAEYSDAIEWYRSLVSEWDTDASACANAIITDVQYLVTEELHFEFIKGHPFHMGPQGFDGILPLLNTIEDTCGDDTVVLREQLAALAIHGLKLFAGRVEDISGPTDPAVVAANADLTDAENFAVLGLWNAAMIEASIAMDDLSNSGYIWNGNWCDGTVVDVYHGFMCDAQALIEDVEALPPNSDLDKAVEKLKNGVEVLSSAAGVKDVIEKRTWKKAAEDLEAGGATTELETLALICQGLTTRFVADAEISNHASTDIPGAEANLATGDAYLTAGDYVTAIAEYANAAKKAKG